MARSPQPEGDTQVAAVVVVQRGQVLLLKRADGDRIFPGYWDLPGGSIEPGESCLEGARRELLEETGISAVQLTEAFHVDLPADPSLGSSPVDSSFSAPRLKVTVFAVGLGAEAAVVLDPREHSEFRWIDISSPLGPNVAVTPGVLNLIQERKQFFESVSTRD